MIASKSKSVPATIYNLVESVVNAGLVFNGVLQQVVVNQPESETEKSYLSHKHIKDALTQLFYALGGE